MARRRKKKRRGGSRRTAAATNVIRFPVTPELARNVLANTPHEPKPDRRVRTPRVTLASQRRRHGVTGLEIGDIVSILNRAEDGDTEKMVDLWLHMLKCDGHLASVWDTRITPVASSDWTIAAPSAWAAAAQLSKPEQPVSPHDPRAVAKADPHEVRLAAACTQSCLRVENLPQTFAAQLNAIGVSFDAAEMIWDQLPFQGQRAWLCTDVKPVHARRFRFDDLFELGLFDGGSAVSTLRAEGWPVDELRSRGARLARLPQGKYIVHQPMGIHDFPTSTGIVYSLARWWWVKQVVTKYWLSGAEIAGNPRLIGKLTQNAPGGVLDALEEGLETLAGDGVIILRDGSEVEIVSGAAKESSEVWDRLFTRMDLVTTKRVLGSTLTVEIDDSGGNRAAIETQANRTLDPRRKMDGDQLWASWRRNKFRAIRDFNPHLWPRDTALPIGKFHEGELAGGGDADQPATDTADAEAA